MSGLTRMDSPQKTTWKIEPQLDVPQCYYELMNAMQRVYNIGLYYPIGHNVADRAIDAFLDIVEGTADKKTGCVHFSVTGQTLSLQKNELDRKQPAVKIFYEMFSALHITSLDIHRDINADEARQFFGEIIGQNSKVRSSRDFSRMIITGLPQTVNVRQLKFTSETGVNVDEAPKGTAQPTLEYLLSSLMDRGVPEEMVSICRELLQSVKGRLEKDNSIIPVLPLSHGKMSKNYCSVLLSLFNHLFRRILLSP